MRDIGKVIEEAKAELLPFASWEKLPGESGAAYAAFCAYRDFGPERNIRKAVENHEANTVKQGKRYRMWLSWSMQFKWVKRAEDYDRYLDRLKQTELRKTIEARGEAHREVTGKMLRMVNKKLDMMNPADLPQGMVTEWVQTAVKTEREIFGLTGGKEKAETGKPGNITFTPDFEGL
ncbi:MAG: hypothetical protein LBB83_02855 [Treponema sp.]|jgi:hypothetical protein|nr:hypothetical protein [Treponema sp.]